MGLEKSRSIKKHIRKLNISEESVSTEPQVILRTIADFYKQLYSSNVITNETEYGDMFTGIRTLANTDSDSCEGAITLKECTEVVNSLKKNKSPGNDGLTNEFYQYFWPQINEWVIDSFNSAYESGELSTSQKQAVITLLDKGKDRMFIENWRPISLLNVDYKIASKVLTKRLDDIIPKVIGINQTGFVKGRFINDTIRTMYDIIEYCKQTETSGLFMMVDFQKAFDSLEWNFLFKTLECMKFGPSFRKWVKLFYCNIESCVINNGTTSPFFKLERGVRQGDPLSAYLFILCVETMAVSVLNNQYIRGISINNTEFKLLQYADDTTAVLKDQNSARFFLSELQRFGKLSGLNINTTKTEAIYLGNTPTFKLPNNIKWCKSPVKVLGVYMGWDLLQAYEDTFREKATNIKNLFHSWKTRSLTLNGKILIIKSLAISQIIYLLNLQPFPDDYIKELEHMIYEFLWNSKTHKVKKSVMTQEYQYGGLKMIDIRTLNLVQKVKWIKLYLNGHDCLWRHLAEALINVKNLNIFLRSNYDLYDNVTKSTFYTDVLSALYKLNAIDQSSTDQNLKNQFLFYNRHIKLNGKIVYDDYLFRAGIWRCCDLFDVNGNVVPFTVWGARGVPASRYLLWRGLLSTVKKYELCMNNRCETISNKCILFSTNEIIDIQCSLSKEMYSKIIKLRKESPTALKTYREYFPLLSDREVENMYILPRICTEDMKLKEFQFKILHRYLPTSVLLYKMKKVTSQKCTFCSVYNETICHLFFDCISIRGLWLLVQNALERMEDKSCVFTCKDVVLGCELQNLSTANLIWNNVILHVKMYLWRCRSLELSPTYVKLKEYIGCRRKYEKRLQTFYDIM